MDSGDSADAGEARAKAREADSDVKPRATPRGLEDRVTGIIRRGRSYALRLLPKLNSLTPRKSGYMSDFEAELDLGVLHGPFHHVRGPRPSDLIFGIR